MSIMVNICGGTNLLKDIGDILNSNGIEVKWHPRRKDNLDNTQLFISKTQNKIRFLDLIYQNATVFLDRKYAKYLKIKETLEL